MQRASIYRLQQGHYPIVCMGVSGFAKKITCAVFRSGSPDGSQQFILTLPFIIINSFKKKYGTDSILDHSIPEIFHRVHRIFFAFLCVSLGKNRLSGINRL